MRAIIFSSVVLLTVSTYPTVAQQRTQQLPTATEVFNLRGRCAALGDRILNNNVIGSALSQSQISHYEPRTNRCYVELTVQTADTTVPMQYLSRTLYDGQTNEMLAWSRLERGKKGGMVFDRQHQTTSMDNAGWDDANDYINEKMADDRN
jgi:hypothetical protein